MRLASRRLPRVLVAPGLPAATRWSLLSAALRRRLAPRPSYGIRYGAGRLELTHDDYAVDWETLKSIVVDRIYPFEHENAVVVDIGAHKGYYGAYALEHGARSVISYEPETANFAFLGRCAERYRGRGRDWRVRRAAVGAAAGEAELHVMDASWGHTLAPPPEWAEYEVGTEAVPIVPMTDVLAEAAELAAGSSLVVKVNAEGAECDIVPAVPAASWRAVTEAFVATHPWAGCDAEGLAAHLRGAGLERRAGGDAHQILRMGR